MLYNLANLWTDLKGPATVDKAVGTLQVAVWAERGRVKVVHALRQVGHEAEFERIIQLKSLVLQHVLSTQPRIRYAADLPRAPGRELHESERAPVVVKGPIGIKAPHKAKGLANWRINVTSHNYQNSGTWKNSEKKLLCTTCK